MLHAPEVTDDGQYPQDRLDQHPHIPSPLWQTFMFAGSPAAAGKPLSVSPIISSANWATIGWKVWSWTLAVAHAQALTKLYTLSTKVTRKGRDDIHQ